MARYSEIEETTPLDDFYYDSLAERIGKAEAGWLRSTDAQIGLLRSLPGHDPNFIKDWKTLRKNLIHEFEQGQQEPPELEESDEYADGGSVHFTYRRVPLKSDEVLAVGPQGPFKARRVMPRTESQTTGHIHERKIGQPRPEAPNFRYEPPPRTRADHDWHRYGKHLTHPDQVLHSFPVRRAAADAADHGLDPAEGVAFAANDFWHRMRHPVRITTEQARHFMAGGVVDLSPTPPQPFRSKPSDRARAPLVGSTMRSGPGGHLRFRTGVREFMPDAKLPSQSQIYFGGVK